MNWGSSMSNPERSDNILKAEYPNRGPGEFYRHGRAGGFQGEESSPKGDLSRLRQSLGPEPQMFHVPQPTRRVSWFVSGFMIAMALGVVIGGVVIVAFPSITGKGSTKTAEVTTRFDNSKAPQDMNAPGVATPAAPAANQASPAGAVA